MSDVRELWLVVGEPDVDAVTECSCCSFDAVLAFPLTSISTEGVAPFGFYAACARCFEKECECRRLP